MWKKTLYSVVVTLLLLSILTFRARVNIQSARAEHNTVVVPDDYPTIQEAINNASEGDTIIVANGTYYEHLEINKSLILIGEGKESTIVDGGRENRTVIEVTAINVVIRGFTVQNSSRAAGTSYAGIKISRRGCNVTGNHITKNKIGILATSQESRIVENVVTKNGQGIALYSCSEVTVEANNVSANTVGISLAFSSGNMIVGNRVANSSGVGGHGITLSSNSTNNTISGNDLINNYHGVWLSNSFDNSILNNTIANNELLGIELASSSDNTFYHNNIVNNPTPVRVGSLSISIWDDGYPSGGNYWHDFEERYPDDEDVYSGPNQDELGSDEIWDKPYIIDEDNKDRYPSVRPYRDISDIIPDEGKLTAEAGLNKTVKMGTPAYFDASESTGNIVSYEWDFGDGTRSTNVTCSHTYSQDGTFTVKLTVKDAAGNFHTDRLIVTVIADEDSAPVDFSPPWVSPLAVVMGVAIVAILFWKYKVSKKMRRKKMRKLRASTIDPKRILKQSSISMFFEVFGNRHWDSYADLRTLLTYTIGSRFIYNGNVMKKF